MRAYSNALKAGVLGLAMITAAPAFSSSAHAGPAPSVDIAALQQDPVHQAAIQASAHKIVFVLGEGFGRRALMSLKNRLNELNLIEGKHYEMMNGASVPKEGGILYVGGQLVKTSETGPTFSFDQYAATDAVSVIRLAIKAGKITIATADLTP